jgi:hypothetical protein
LCLRGLSLFGFGLSELGDITFTHGRAQDKLTA